jgi:hypothetical protein
VGNYFTPNEHNLGDRGARPGPGITPNVYAPDHPPDEDLAVAVRTRGRRGRECVLVRAWWNGQRLTWEER